MSFIDGFPQTVTIEQMRAACAALGLPTRNVVAISSDVRGPQAGVTVLLHVADDAGNKLADPGGGPLLTELHIPMWREEEDDGGTP